MERAEVTRLGQLVDREVKARFAPGAVRRVAVLQEGDDHERLGRMNCWSGSSPGRPTPPGTVSLPWIKSGQATCQVGITRLRR